MSGFKKKEATRKEPVVAAMISEETIKAEQSETQKHNTDTQYRYTIQQEEKRSTRLQFVVKPSVNVKLDQMVKEGKIKSKNDLVNFLLESYIAQEG